MLLPPCLTWKPQRSHCTWLLWPLLLWLVNLDVLLEAEPTEGRERQTGTQRPAGCRVRLCRERQQKHGVMPHTGGQECACVCECVACLGRAKTPQARRAFVAPLVQAALPAPGEPLCKAILFLTYPGSMSFPGRSIYYGSPCGSDGYSHWGKRRTDAPGGRESSRNERVGSQQEISQQG